MTILESILSVYAGITTFCSILFVYFLIIHKE